jgi:hypothetical protein
LFIAAIGEAGGIEPGLSRAEIGLTTSGHGKTSLFIDSFTVASNGCDISRERMTQDGGMIRLCIGLRPYGRRGQHGGDPHQALADRSPAGRASCAGLKVTARCHRTGHCTVWKDWRLPGCHEPGGQSAQVETALGGALAAGYALRSRAAA